MTQRHIARSIAASSRQSLVGMAGMILGLIAASRSGGGDLAQAAIVGSQAAMLQGQINFTRDMEREADRIGYGVLSTAGFSPGGVAAMFEQLEGANRLNDNGASYPYLRTHPLNSERIGEARARAQAVEGQMPVRPTLVHALMQARSRVLMAVGVDALRRLQAQDAPAAGPLAPLERLPALYASVLASLQLNEPARAMRAWAEIDSLLRSSSVAGEAVGQRVVGLLRVDSLLAAGQPASALSLLDKLEDGSRPLLLLRAQAALQNVQAGGDRDALKRSADALLTWVTDRRQDALAWSQLALCANELGQRLRAVRAEAEARAAVGDLTGALDRLRSAQRMARSGEASDFVESSVIDARARQLERERRRMIAAARGEPEPEH